MLWKDKGRHKDNICEEKVFGSVSTGSLIPCQTAQARESEWEVRWCEIGGVKLAGIAEESVEFSFSPVLLKKQLSTLTPDFWLGHLFCSKNVL